MYFGKPPKSCPYYTDNFYRCNDCAYYQLKEETKYFKKFMNMFD